MNNTKIGVGSLPFILFNNNYSVFTIHEGASAPIFGSGRRIRTLTDGVRVRSATVTQSRYSVWLRYRSAAGGKGDLCYLCSIHRNARCGKTLFLFLFSVTSGHFGAAPRCPAFFPAGFCLNPAHSSPDDSNTRTDGSPAVLNPKSLQLLGNFGSHETAKCAHL